MYFPLNYYKSLPYYYNLYYILLCVCILVLGKIEAEANALGTTFAALVTTVAQLQSQLYSKYNIIASNYFTFLQLYNIVVILNFMYFLYFSLAVDAETGWWTNGNELRGPQAVGPLEKRLLCCH